MKRFFLSIAVAISATSVMTNAEVMTFEDVGTVQSVQISNRVIAVNDTYYSLPSHIVIDGEAAIIKLQPGYLIGFSGTVASPYNQIDSLFLYPESILEAEQNLESDTTKAGGKRR